MHDKVFTTTAEMERALVERALGGALVLAATGRLARRVVDRCRRRMIEGGRAGWEAPRVYALRRFIGESYKSLWPADRMPSPVKSMLLWHEAASSVPRPEGLDLSPLLYTQLQQSLDGLLENGVEPIEGPPGPPLPEWRRRVSKEYLKSMAASGLVLFPEVCRRTATAFESGRLSIPGPVVVAGFHRMKPVEEMVVRAFSRSAEVVSVRAAQGADVTPEATPYASPEQECRAVCAEVLSAWNSGERNLGVVFLDEDYFPLLSRLFMELVDREPLPENAIRFNIAGGTPLLEHPLYQAAVLPLRLGDAPRPHELLLSLLASPYAAARPTASALKDAVWGGGVPARGESLYRRVGIAPLTAFASLKKAKVREWLSSLESLWTAIGFPAPSGESDELALRHLREAISQLKAEAGGMEADAGGVLSWLNAAVRNYQIALRTPETAGIQILSLAESRGLSFSRLWVTGAHGRVLPSPGREAPFLTADEAACLPGGEEGDRWGAAEMDVRMLGASAPLVSWSRAASNGEDSPYLGSPLVRDREGAPKTLDLWGDAPAAFMRARWLREGLKGLGTPPPGGRAESVVAALPGEMRVTSLETLLSCPFKYFSAELLGLEELEAPEAGVSRLEKGSIAHGVLEAFGRACIKDRVRLDSEPEKAGELLAQACADVFSALPDDEVHRVERERLCGGDGRGLLYKWLEAEIERARAGWRFVAVEAAFDGLELGSGGLRLRGKIDRIDVGASGGTAVWDYKTGTPPSVKEVLDLKVRPQLPAYLLAVRQGLAGVGDGKAAASLEAGYICLNRERDISVKTLKANREAVDWAVELPRWEDGVSERLSALISGGLAADPRPAPGSSNKDVCRYCPFMCLCGYFDGGGPEPEDDRGVDDD